ncbi:MAG TPA: hypothetical protein VI953_02730 [Candidatus Paceibacterota bacterium]
MNVKEALAKLTQDLANEHFDPSKPTPKEAARALGRRMKNKSEAWMQDPDQIFVRFAG